MVIYKNKKAAKEAGQETEVTATCPWCSMPLIFEFRHEFVHNTISKLVSISKPDNVGKKFKS